MSLLEIRQLRVQFGATEAVQGIDLDVESGELFGVILVIQMKHRNDSPNMHYKPLKGNSLL